MGNAYRIQAGQIRSVAIPAEGLRIRLPNERPSEELVALPGAEADHWSGHTLEVVRELATSITPWASWWIAPGFERKDFAGEAHTYRDLVALRADCHQRFTVEMAFHEAWHIAEVRLDPDEFEVVDRAVKGGHDWKDTYFNSTIERRARLFAGWAAMALETGTPHVDKRRPETKVFQFVYSGGLGLRLARRNSIPKSRMSAALKAAAAVPERRPAREIPIALGGLATAGAVAWLVPWVALAPYLAVTLGLAVTAWAMWPNRRTAD